MVQNYGYRLVNSGQKNKMYGQIINYSFFFVSQTFLSSPFS